MSLIAVHFHDRYDCVHHQQRTVPEFTRIVPQTTLFKQTRVRFVGAHLTSEDSVHIIQTNQTLTSIEPGCAPKVLVWKHHHLYCFCILLFMMRENSQACAINRTRTFQCWLIWLATAFMSYAEKCLIGSKAKRCKKQQAKSNLYADLNVIPWIDTFHSSPCFILITAAITDLI